MSKLSAYGKTADQSQLLVERHAPLVKRIALHLMARLPASVQLDDLIQSGMIGLIEAGKKFDGGKGASFETYAGIRIRGAMLDEIRRGDWTPRSVHRNGRLIANTIAELEAELGRDVKDTEVAEKLDVTIDEYHQMINEVSSGKIVGIEDLGVTEDVIVADGTDEAAARLGRVLWNDPATGVMRHADAGYDIAKNCAVEQGLDLPMIPGANGKKG